MQEAFIEGFKSNTLSSNNYKGVYGANIGSSSTNKSSSKEYEEDNGHWITLKNGNHIFIEDEKKGKKAKGSSSKTSSNKMKGKPTGGAASITKNSKKNIKVDKVPYSKEQKIENKKTKVNYVSDKEFYNKLFPVSNLIKKEKEKNPDNFEAKMKKKEINKTISKNNTTFSDKTLKQARKFIYGEEGLYLYAYDDKDNHCPHPEIKPGDKVIGTLTIGYGHTKGVKQGDTITKEQAKQFLYEDFEEHSRALRYIKVPLTENQKIALTSFAYNVGIYAFKNSTLVKKLNTGDYEGAANEFEKWIKGDSGLLTRRKKEKALFLNFD